MTDNEIIKALECCAKSGCKNCPENCGSAMCLKNLVIDSLDLINRQKAENEILEKELMKCKLEKEMLHQTVEEIKSEAIKEFAERLKSKIWHSPECNYIRSITPDYIDNLVKEMTEVETNQRNGVIVPPEEAEKALNKMTD